MASNPGRRAINTLMELDNEVVRLNKKVLQQRKALRDLSKAHARLWLAIRVMNPMAKEAIEEERANLREDFAMMKAAFNARKEARKVSQDNNLAMAFLGTDCGENT